MLAARQLPGNVGPLWYCESANNLPWELSAPRIVALEHAEQSRANEAPPGAGDTTGGGEAMERLIERVGGLDVHKQTVAACVRVPSPKGTREQHVRTFGTTATELVALREWLAAHRVTDVAMESTGVY